MKSIKLHEGTIAQRSTEGPGSDVGVSAPSQSDTFDPPEDLVLQFAGSILCTFESMVENEDYSGSELTDLVLGPPPENGWPVADLLARTAEIVERFGDDPSPIYVLLAASPVRLTHIRMVQALVGRLLLKLKEDDLYGAVECGEHREICSVEPSQGQHRSKRC